MLKFEKESDNLWIASEEDYGDWKGFPIFEVVDMCDFVNEVKEDDPQRFIGNLNVVSLTQLSKKKIKEVKKSAGYPDDFKWDRKTLAIECYRYGYFAPLKSNCSKTAYGILRKISNELIFTYSLIGFFLDSIKNRIGHTGWDFLKGDLSLEAAKRNLKNLGVI